MGKLYLLAKQHKTKQIKKLISLNKININEYYTDKIFVSGERTKYVKRTVLMWLCENGYFNMTRILVRAGCDVNLKDSYGNYAIHFACKEKIFKFLIHNGADVNARDEFDQTPLFWACYRGYFEAMCELIDRKCNIDMQMIHSGLTVLMFAAKHNIYEGVKILIEAGCNLDIQNKKARTALMFACSHNNYKIAKLLIDAGCNINLTDNKNRTALQIILTRTGYSYWLYDDLIELLIKNYAIIKPKLTKLHTNNESYQYLTKLIDKIVLEIGLKGECIRFIHEHKDHYPNKLQILPHDVKKYFKTVKKSSTTYNYYSKILTNINYLIYRYFMYIKERWIALQVNYFS